MNFAQQMQLKSLPQEQKIAYLQSLKQGLTQEQAFDWLKSVEVPVDYAQKKREDIDSMAIIMERCELLRRTVKSLPPPEPPDHFARDILLNQYLMGGSTSFDEASLHSPKLKRTQVIRDLMALRPRVALIIGEPGSGKSWGTLAYMNSLSTARGIGKVEYSNSAFVTAFKLSEMVNNQKRFHIQLDELLKTKYLLIDDLGAEPSGFRGSDFIAYFDYLFSERHKFRRSTFITSNATVDDSMDKNGVALSGLKSVYGGRFISRFNEIGILIETADNDMRAPES